MQQQQVNTIPLHKNLMVENSMPGTIFERYEFLKLETCCEKYMPLISAIDENYSMERLGLYESSLSDGLFIHCRLELSLPTNGVYKELDVRSDEEILIFVKSDYPFFAPAVLFVRNDFPTSRIPHLNLGIANSNIHLLNPCLYRGDVNEWFFQNGPSVLACIYLALLPLTRKWQ